MQNTAQINTMQQKVILKNIHTTVNSLLYAIISYCMLDSCTEILAIEYLCLGMVPVFTDRHLG